MRIRLFWTENQFESAINTIAHERIVNLLSAQFLDNSQRKLVEAELESLKQRVCDIAEIDCLSEALTFLDSIARQHQSEMSSRTVGKAHRVR